MNPLLGFVPVASNLHGKTLEEIDLQERSTKKEEDNSEEINLSKDGMIMGEEENQG